jgi:hypothetical protein
MQALRRPWVWIPLLLVLLFGAAVIGGYTLLPGLVRSQGSDWVEKNLPGKQLAMGGIKFDPWQLLLTINDFAIADGKAPDAPLVTIKQLQVDASIASLWARAARLDALIIDQPVVDAILRKDGSLNLVELIPVDDGSPIPDVRIGNLDVKQGLVKFTDARAATPDRRTLTPVTFNLKDFATTANEGGGFRLDATSDARERVQWAGTVGMAPLASTGRFTITDLQLATIGRFAGDMIPAKLTAGGIDLAGQYSFSAPPAAKGAAPPPLVFNADLTSFALENAAITASTGDKIALDRLSIAPTKISLAADDVTLGALSLSGLSIARPSGERAKVTSARLAPTHYAITSGIAAVGAADVTGISVSGRGKNAETVALASLGIAPSEVRMTPHEARIGAVSATGLRLGAKVAADNSVSVPGLYPMKLPASSGSSGPDWKVALDGFDLKDAAVRLAVERPTPVKGTVINLAPMTARLGPLTTAMDRPLDMDFATGINGKAKFALKGKANPKTASGDFDINLAGLPLAEVAALAPPSAVVVESGVLGAKGRLSLASTRAGPQPGFNGDVQVTNFALNERVDGNPVITWGSLDISGIKYQPAPQKLAIARIAFAKAVSHVIFTRAAKLNLATAAGVEQPGTPPPGIAAPQAAPVATPVAAPVASPPAPPKAKLKPGRQRIQIAAPVSGTLNAAAKQFPVTIGEIAVRDSIISFEDFSIEPNFAAKIEGFNGKVTGLSTAPGSQATFDLKGYIIDRFSPVSITGRANVFAYDANTDLTAKFSNIELPVFNPYSGKWAGYAIAKGKLTTTLHYRIVNRGLNADHNIVIDQLTWGEATDSKEKVSLPIRMATSLLKDKDGVIDLDLPVEGTLDDPTFRIWPIVWKVVGNVLTKIITAPFTAIGALFGGGDKAQFVDFDYGSAVVPPDADKSLKAVAKGLAEKTEVNLDIPAGPAIKEDAEVMTTRALETAVLAGKKAPLAADYASLDAGKKLDRLKSLYKAKFGKGPSFPKDGVTKAGLLAGGEAKAAANASQIAWLETELRPKFAPTDAQLAALGQARADAVKQVLLSDGSIQPTRVFIAGDKSVKAKDDKAEMELSVK